MIRAGTKRLALILSSTVFLVACEEGSEFKLFKKPLFDKSASAGEASAQQTATGALVEKDVEAPEVFQQTEAGLWDGRPSLGGVWVAHPEVIDPERVLIRNEANGKFVIGALFRRERDNPGPRFQVSSDAAASLGMLAGAPSEVSAVVLRRQQVQTIPDEVTPVSEPTEPQLIEETKLEPSDKTDPVAKMAESAIAAAAASGTAGSGAISGTKPMDATKPVAQAATNTAPAQTAVAAAKPTSSLAKPFIQIGIFSIQANADRTAQMLRKEGVIPTVKHSSSNGKEFWRVIVGPVGNVSGRNAVIKKVKGLGFADAYAVTN